MESDKILNFKHKYSEMEEEIKRNIIGQEEVVRNIIIGIIAGGNVLLEGEPGLGKTELIKTIGEVLSLSFSRIQFTPDLMPVDIIGTVVINKKGDNLDFNFEKGPIFSSLVLADEINRATPKTQSAMLEAMQEKTVTVGRTTYKLPDPFFVLATQNPLEMEGTYPLPEAQLDRFMLKLQINLPDVEKISEIIDLTTSGGKKEKVKTIASGEDIIEMREIAREIPVAEEVRDYAIKIMMETRPESSNIQMVKDYVTCGASIRAVQSIISSAKVKALIEGRFNVSYEDIQSMAYPCLRHRIFLNFSSATNKIDTDMIIEKILKQVK